MILHSRADDVILFADSEELAKNSGAALIEVGNHYAVKWAAISHHSLAG